ncbi:hypothetical protein HK105_206705 [Polyrhizophydium stewartii]|uniref:Uncharacterized protein n=1 Tax=Polyrhizophydium stewartii TaxID=2732419 RepID=A0ABR4N2S4_9FUNG|nr:hypothetical protein HK105_004070 [Polyrhizophydium stewartii]
MADRLRQPFETVRVTFPAEHVAHVELARTKQLNSMTTKFFNEFIEVFEAIRIDNSVRAVVVSAETHARGFTAGLDLKESADFPKSGDDPAREAIRFLPKVQQLQRSFNVIEKCDKPVIAAVHGFCIGGGIDLIAACDIRFCSKDARFTVKEVDIGIAADLGTLQRLPKIVGNHSWVRDICYTARFVPAQEALQFGLVSRVLDDKEQLIKAALETAKLIASKSPVAVLGTKHLLNYSREHTVEEGLQYTAVWNSVMINTQDMAVAVASSLSKQPAVFAKL